jgi:uncharacterized protein YcfJ
MDTRVKLTLLAAGCIVATQAAAQITFYDGEGYSGRSFTTSNSMDNLERRGFNDRASSVVVARDRWEVCEDAGYRGRCMVLRPGSYPSLEAMGLGDRISSMRVLAHQSRVEDHRYAPAPMAQNDYRYAPAPVAENDYRRREHERLYDARITSVRAVVASSGQHCWVERHEVTQQDSGANVPGAIAGAVIGGILGHQVGGGRGQDVATAGGAVAGAAVGANVGRNHGTSAPQDVQRCENRGEAAHPEYWDVTYDFRGREHHVQLAAPPGETIVVNEQGEPRA